MYVCLSFVCMQSMNAQFGDFFLLDTKIGEYLAAKVHTLHV